MNKDIFPNWVLSILKHPMIQVELPIEKKIPVNRELVGGMKDEQIFIAGFNRQKNRKTSPEQAVIWIQNAFPVTLLCDSIS